MSTFGTKKTLRATAPSLSSGLTIADSSIHESLPRVVKMEQGASTQPSSGINEQATDRIIMPGSTPILAGTGGAQVLKVGNF